MSQILLIGAEKGGPGKSTTATNLAAALVIAGCDAVLLDADPQGTAAAWAARREEDLQLKKILCFHQIGDIYGRALELGAAHEAVIIDAGGRDSTELRTAMAAADLLIIPMQASQPDLETLPRMEALIEKIRAPKINPDLVVAALLTRISTHLMSTEERDARAGIAAASDILVLRSVLRDRKVYRDAFPLGRSVVEMDNSKARAEVQLLVSEIWEG